MADNVADEQTPPAFGIAVTLAVGAVVILIVLVFNVGKGTGSDKSEAENEPGKGNAKKKQQQSQKKQKAGWTEKKSKRATQKAFSHPYLCCTLKGHAANIVDIDFSINGKYLASAAEDRTVRVWSVKEFKEKEH
ncbi:transducin beta-like protein 2, partial [Saccoglossus kowalevskii]